MSEEQQVPEQQNDNSAIFESQRNLQPNEEWILNEQNTNVYGFYNVNIISDIPVCIKTSSGAINCNFKQFHVSGIELPDLTIENFNDDKIANVNVTISGDGEQFNIPLI